MKINKLVLLLVVLSLFLSGCSSTSTNINEDGVRVLKFKDSISTAELKKLDGKEVQITGFIGGASPLNGSYIYLMNIPYQSCAFCVPSDNNLGNTIAVYPPQGKTIEYKDTPVTVTGTLVFETITDPVGYTYEYSIQNAKVEDADVEGLESQVQIYTALVDKGFVVKYNELSDLIYNNTVNAVMGKPVVFKTLTPISDEYITNLRGLLDGLNKADYEDVIFIIDTIEEAVNLFNEGVNLENIDLLIQSHNKGGEAFNLFYAWLVKPEL